MKMKRAFPIAVVLFTVAIGGLRLRVEAKRDGYQTAQPQTATLLSQIKHHDSDKANFDFRLGLRGDSIAPSARRYFDVRYGGLSFNGDNDWLDVPIAHGSRSKIIDMGEMNWSEVFDVPYLPPHPAPYDGLRTETLSKGKLIKSSPEDTLVKAAVGHLYLLHTKTNNRDLSVMFRVEALIPGEEVTITWKAVASTENN